MAVLLAVPVVCGVRLSVQVRSGIAHERCATPDTVHAGRNTFCSVVVMLCLRKYVPWRLFSAAQELCRVSGRVSVYPEY